jgi:hypothetical protein
MRKHHETAVGMLPMIVAVAPIALGVTVGAVIRIKEALKRKDGGQ